MDESINFAKKYLEDVLSFFGLNTDVKASREDEVIELSVPSTHLNGFLIGNRGDTLRALQYLVSSALRSNDMELNRVNLDIADYKKQRNDRLAEKAEGWARKVRDEKKKMSLEPMNPADRRVVHKAVSDIGGVATESEGEGRDRHIVLFPMDDEIVEPEEKPSKKEDEPTEEDQTTPSTKDETTDEATSDEESTKDE